jgi:hypothetical protein
MAESNVRLDDLISSVLADHPGGDALTHLSDAMETSAHLGELADHLIGHFVDQARRSGATWTEIGEHMGVSKQAAQQRFVPRESDDEDFPTTGRLSRFTPRARNVLADAKQRARDLGHDRVTNDHILLGLIDQPEGLAAEAIVANGPTLDQVRGAVTSTLDSGRRPGRTRPGFSREAKKTIELSLRDALRLGHNYIGTEHLLLGLLRNDKERAARLLVGLGVTHDGVDAWVRDAIDRIMAARKKNAAG